MTSSSSSSKPGGSGIDFRLSLSLSLSLSGFHSTDHGSLINRPWVAACTWRAGGTPWWERWTGQGSGSGSKIEDQRSGSRTRIKGQDGLNGQYSYKTCAFFVFSEAMGCGWFGSHCWSPAISAGPKLGLHSVHCSTLCAQCLLLVLSLLCIARTAHRMLVLSLHCPTQCAQCTLLVLSLLGQS